MAKGTPAIAALERAGVAFTLHEYKVGDDGGSYGEAVAAALGVDPGRLFKTLIASVDGSPVVAIVPVAGRLSLKRLASAAGGKRAVMAEPSDAQRLTGYVVGGISPFGQRRRLPVYLDATATGFTTIYVSAGRRGLQMELTPESLVAVTGAAVVPLAG